MLDRHVEGIRLPGIRMLRLLTYPLHRIEKLLSRLAEDPAAFELVIAVSDKHVRKRLERFVMTANKQIVNRIQSK